MRRRDGRIFSQRATLRWVGPGDDVVADLPICDLRSDLCDRPGQIGPQRIGKLHGEILVHELLLDLDVERVERGCGHPHEHFILANDRHGGVVD